MRRARLDGLFDRWGYAADSVSSSSADDPTTRAAESSSSRSTSASRSDSLRAVAAALTVRTRRYAASRSAQRSPDRYAAKEPRCSSHSPCDSERPVNSRHVPDATVWRRRDSIARSSAATSRVAARSARRLRRCSCHALRTPVTRAPTKPPTSAANSASNRQPHDADPPSAKGNHHHHVARRRRVHPDADLIPPT
jgi:hypothetical protein